MAYTAPDCAIALQKLSGLASGRCLQYPNGADVPAPEEIQQRWMAIDQGGAAGAVETHEHLKVIYNYVEAVIITCGAPDTFDVYEASFEVLTKVGSFMQGPASKDLLTTVLTDIHEVYDVLLSCVETYEWFQPGATGLLRLYMLQVVFLCFGHANITGKHLMELTDNDVSGAVSLLSFVLRCQEAPFELQNVACRCLVFLTTADSVFLEAEGAPAAGLDTQNQQITKLTEMLNCHVNGLIKGIIQFETIEAFGKCICQHQMSHVRTDILVKSFLTTVHNCLLYCSNNQQQLRQHLATQSTVVQDIMVPYVYNILPALKDNPSLGPASLEWQNLRLVMQTFVVVTFNIANFRSQLCQSDMIPQVCEAPHILTNITMLELLIKLAINIDFTKSPHHDAIFAYLRHGWDGLPEQGQARLRRRLSPHQSGRLPFSKSSVQALQELSFALVSADGLEAAMPATGSRGKKTRLFAIETNAIKATDGDYAAGEESEDDDMPALIPLNQLPIDMGMGQEVGIPTRAQCELSGALMTDPVQTPDGHCYERAALEDWVTMWQTNPATGQPLHLGDCAANAQLQGMIQSYQMHMFAASQLSGPDPFGSDVPLAPPEEAPRQTYLGDLPSLAAPLPTSPKGKKAKGKISIASRSVVDCPEDMRCKIDGKVLINPLRSPHGHLFEKKTLEKWFTNCGSVCPVTGQPMRMEECTVDAEMRKRVVKFLKGEGA